MYNKPRTAKVGAISKAQNLKGGPFGLCETPAGCKKIEGETLWRHEKISQINFLLRFLNSVTVPKNVKGGTLCEFLTSIVLQNIETNEGGTLWCNPKNFKKSRIVPKKSGAKVGSLVCFRGCGRLFCFFFVLDALLRLELLRFEVVEQMNKKVDLTCLKKTTHCNSRAHFLLKCAD